MIMRLFLLLMMKAQLEELEEKGDDDSRGNNSVAEEKVVSNDKEEQSDELVKIELTMCIEALRPIIEGLMNVDNGDDINDIDAERSNGGEVPDAAEVIIGSVKDNGSIDVNEDLEVNGESLKLEGARM